MMFDNNQDQQFQESRAITVQYLRQLRIRFHGQFPENQRQQSPAITTYYW